MYDSAILESGSDFVLAMNMGTFQVGENRTCTSITILADNIVEDMENFTVTLPDTQSDVLVRGNASTTTVFIDDDDGELLYNHIYRYNAS